jgi:stearoyl-CoA desaturase (Delta-9 desaturase)
MARAEHPEGIHVATVRARTTWPSRLVTFLAVAGPPLGLISVMGLLWGVAARPVDVLVLIAMYIICGLGISVGYHRYFTHKSFETTRWMRATLAILGSMTLQGPVTQWVTDHRKHHALSDKPGDPHSPHTHGDGWAGTVLGLWHAHVGWLFRTKGMERGLQYGRDLYEDRMIRWIDRLYFVWVAATFAIPFVIGWAIGDGSLQLGVEAFVWGGVLRIFLFQHVTWSVNSVCHRFGRRPFATRDESRNNVAIALLTFGEGWHNNHHAFPSSARHGLLPRQFDLSAVIIRGLERVGVVWDVKLPEAASLTRRRQLV